MATSFLNLTLPTVTVTLGPTWATQINAAFEVIDEHDHTSGKGVQIPTAGLNINDDLDFNDNAAQNIEFLSFLLAPQLGQKKKSHYPRRLCLVGKLLEKE